MKPRFFLSLCVFSLASLAGAQRLPQTVTPENYKLTLARHRPWPQPDFRKCW